MKFDPFVLPFLGGMVFVLFTVFAKWTIWFKALTKQERRIFSRALFSHKTITASGEVFSESLLHRKIFRINPWLGYMHMSLAFGWFLLIVAGNLEARWHSHGHLNPPYYPIFFEFFVHDLRQLPYRKFFVFAMDFLLLFVLSGVTIAVIKRFRSKVVGMKKTTRLKTIDKVALISLWLIFPLRLLAESFNAGLYDTGGFLTNTLGNIFAKFLPLEYLCYPTWWAYSISLGLFFVAVPFTRYMHILTEVFLIYLRSFGIKEKHRHTSYTQVEINSCSRCGICIDKCQLSSDLNISNIQPAYFNQLLRDNNPQADITKTCMICGRCNDFCPVGIENTAIRINQRKENPLFTATSYCYVGQSPAVKKAEVAYFAGCMGHLNPSTINAMKELFHKADVNFTFVDADGSICCGRPLKLAGNSEAAAALASKNSDIIAKSGAKYLVTSCPICYKTFKEDYRLSIPVYHHSEYLLQLVAEEKIHVKQLPTTVAYHDPCDLGRGSNIYKQPRTLLNQSAKLVKTNNEKTNSLCCGGSLGTTVLGAESRATITQKTLASLTINKPDIIATACPLCKKTFAAQSTTRVADIAEILLEAAVDVQKPEKLNSKVVKRVVEKSVVLD